jgi:hypothetical protein
MSAGNDRRTWVGWKEIARRLDKDVSTVMRGEEERGLPVRRVPGKARGSVFVYEDELVAWLDQSRPTNQDASAMPLRDDVAGVPQGFHRRDYYLVIAVAVAALASIVVLALASARVRTSYRTTARVEVAEAGLTAFDVDGGII